MLRRRGILQDRVIPVVRDVVPISVNQPKEMQSRASTQYRTTDAAAIQSLRILAKLTRRIGPTETEHPRVHASNVCHERKARM
jgi:hypothetical protein